MPRATLVRAPHFCVWRGRMRVAAIMTPATLAKARLNPVSPKPLRSIRMRGAVEKNTKNVPIAVAKPSV